ncbi:hypothetical protein DPSP01_003773 [Paraphaeosphaeria sporulosa]
MDAIYTCFFRNSLLEPCAAARVFPAHTCTGYQGGQVQITLEASLEDSAISLSLRDAKTRWMYRRTAGLSAASMRSIFTGSKATFDRANSWLANCIKSHQKCEVRSTIRYPTRLWEVYESDTRRIR